MQSDHTQNVCSDAFKKSHPFAGVLRRRETYVYGAHTNSQDFTYTILLNPHNNIVKLVVLFLLTEIQTQMKLNQED